MHRLGRAEGVRPIEAGALGPLDEQRDRERILASDAGAVAAPAASTPDATSTPRPRRCASSAVGHLRRSDPAGQHHGHLARDGRHERSVDHRPGAARVHAARGVEEDPFGAGLEVGVRLFRRPGGVRRAIVRDRLGRQMEHLPDRPAATRNLAHDIERLARRRAARRRPRGPGDAGTSSTERSTVTATTSGRPARADLVERTRRASATPRRASSARGVPGTRFSPIASAPARTAAGRPSSSIDATDLHERRHDR